MQAELLKIFYKSGVINNPLPVNFKEKDIAIFKKDTVIKLAKSGLFLFKNVHVTDIGVIYKDFIAIKENIICYDSDFKNYKFRYFLKTFLKFKKAKYRGNKGILIFDNYSGPNGFAHWICDGLTRLAEINEELSEYTIIVPSYFKDQKIYLDSLNFFNISKALYLEKNTLTHFKELYFPSPIAETGNFNPENVKKLRNIISPPINASDPAKRNIYISRAKANRRFVTNETEVVELLNKYDFDTIYLEDHSFPEQVKILSSAANIISIHGAALAMILFAPNAASVMELRSSKDEINNMYYILANANMLNYYYLLCESNEKTKTANNFDLFVNISELEQSVKQMLLKK